MHPTEEEAAAISDNLPQMSPEVQFELALLLLVELDLEEEDCARLKKLIEWHGVIRRIAALNSSDGSYK